MDKRSEEKLQGVNDKLVRIVSLASKSSSFIVTEGVRTIERQKELVAKGASKTMESKHLVGRAVDLAPLLNGEVRWDWPLFYPMAKAMKDAANQLGIRIVWGGDWKTFKDGPHFELGDEE